MVPSTTSNQASCDTATSIYFEASNVCLGYIHMLRTPLYKDTQTNPIKRNFEIIITK